MTRRTGMAAVQESLATLRFYSDDDGFDPKAITRLLGRTPTESWRKGEPLRSGRARQVGGWRLESGKRSPQDVDGQITEILSAISDDPAVWRELSRYKPDMFVGLFMSGTNEGLQLRPETLALMAARGITLGLDIYGPASEDAE